MDVACGPLATLFGLSIFAGPRIGITSTIALAIAGQVASGAIIDHFGAFGLAKIPASTRARVISVLLLAGGSTLTLSH